MDETITPEYQINYQYSRNEAGWSQCEIVTENSSVVLSWAPQVGVLEADYLINNLPAIIAGIGLQEGFIDVEQEVDPDPAGQ